mmetsp:Transcript_8943/g.27369  ORF Transcript_8943/g.27369 Transcript_8943/m.27369 type:complete len:239 (-) Transcript_8943:2222-2938(-)
MGRRQPSRKMGPAVGAPAHASQLTNDAHVNGCSVTVHSRSRPCCAPRCALQAMRRRAWWTHVRYATFAHLRRRGARYVELARMPRVSASYVTAAAPPSSSCTVRATGARASSACRVQLRRQGGSAPRLCSGSRKRQMHSPSRRECAPLPPMGTRQVIRTLPRRRSAMPLPLSRAARRLRSAVADVRARLLRLLPRPPARPAPPPLHARSSTSWARHTACIRWRSGGFAHASSPSYCTN